MSCRQRRGPVGDEKAAIAVAAKPPQAAPDEGLFLSGKRASFSLERRLLRILALTNGVVLAGASALYLWRGYVKHEAFEEGRKLLDWFMAELTTDVLPMIIPLFLASLAATALTLRRGLVEIKSLSQRAAGFDPSRLDVRLPQTGVPSEILPLIVAINAALDRLAEGFETQRRFTASAAHELRTPLAVLRARCAGRDCPVSPVVAKDIDRMARIVDQLLAVARLETRQVVLDGPVELRALCELVVADLYPIALAGGRDLGLWATGPWTIARGNDIVLADALRNIVDNALRLSPPGEAVEIELLAGGIIRVLDRGPGVPDERKTEIFQPFRRGGGKEGGGAGLGLCIASEVVALHGGLIEVMDRPGGGAVFVVDLSPAGPSG